GHTLPVYSVAFSPDGNSIVSGSYDKTIRTWDAHRPSPIGEPLTAHSDLVWSVAYSPLGNVISSGSHDKTIRLWDVNTRRQLGTIKGDHYFLSVAFSPDAKLIASGCDNYSYSPSSYIVQLWDVQKMTAVANPFKGHTDSVCSVQFSPDGSRLVSGSHDNTIRVWDVERGTTVVGPLKGHTDVVCSVAFSPEGSQIASCSHDRTVWMWDARDGKLIGNPYEGHTDEVNSVAFSPRDTYVASGGDDKTVRIWDVRTCRQVNQPFQEHADKMDTHQNTAMIASGGGFGDIWVGQLHNGTKVAIKAWRTNALQDCEQKTIKCAAREIYYWSLMEHRNIHHLMGVIVFKDQYLGMVSEWMENGNLREYLRTHPDANRYQLCIDVTSGLEYMHAGNTVHGDVKA
ncbi:tyrosine kinase catalytic domain protein, partial [Rhizoctonia solani 123E]